jgi:formylglycine-generating enzyme
MRIFLSIIFFSSLCSFGFTQNKINIEWIEIPAGTFSMGSLETEIFRSDNEPLHNVTLSAYKMSKYEITISQFKSFLDATGYVTDAEKQVGYKGSVVIKPGNKFEPKKGTNWKCDETGKERPHSEYDHPVVHVSWNDAKAFADWMGCYLPTEAEWEYACRAGTSTPFNTGENLTTAQANFNGNYPYYNGAKGEYRECTMPVGSFAPNGWGLCDMHGNVDEWCSDWYDGGYRPKILIDPQGPTRGTWRIMRGGNWKCQAKECRSAKRFFGTPEGRSCFVGFRIISTTD